MTNSKKQQFVYCSTYNWYDKPVREDEGLYRRISIQVQDKGQPVYGFNEQGHLNTGVKEFLHFKSDVGWLGVNTRFAPKVSLKDITKVDDATFTEEPELGHMTIVYKTDEHYFKTLSWPNYAFEIDEGYLYLSDMESGTNEMIKVERIVAIIGAKNRRDRDYELVRRLCDAVQTQIA